MIAKVKINTRQFKVIENEDSTIKLIIALSDLEYFEEWMSKCTFDNNKRDYVQDLNIESSTGNHFVLYGCFPILLTDETVKISYDFMKKLNG